MSEALLAPPASRPAAPTAREAAEGPARSLVAGCRPLAPLSGLPAPLVALTSREIASGELRLLLRLPATASARTLTRPPAPLGSRHGSALLPGPLAVERAAGALWAVYPLPAARPPGPCRAAASEGAAPAPPLPSTVADLLAVGATVPCPHPELLALLVLAGCLDAVRELHARGEAHGLLAPGFLLLAGAPPARLLADCPRDPAVRLFGQRVAAALEPAARCHPEDDLWRVASFARSLLATQVSEPPGEAAPGSVAARLELLLAALQAPDPARRPSAGSAAALCRELALRALADWDYRRDARGVKVRYAALAQRQRGGGGVGQRGARAGDRAFPWSREGAEPRQTRPVALARERTDARPEPPSGVPALAASELARGRVEGASWVALVPSLLAALLSLLLAVTLLLGS